VFIIVVAVVYFSISSVRKLFDTPSFVLLLVCVLISIILPHYNRARFIMECYHLTRMWHLSGTIGPLAHGLDCCSYGYVRVVCCQKLNEWSVCCITA